jgi:hypothetical protein
VGLNRGGGEPGVGRAGKNAVPQNNRILPPTLAEAKIDKKLSSRAQKLAALSTEEFEDRVTEWRARTEYGADRVAANVLREPKAPNPSTDGSRYFCS